MQKIALKNMLPHIHLPHFGRDHSNDEKANGTSEASSLSLKHKAQLRQPRANKHTAFSDKERASLGMHEVFLFTVFEWGFERVN